MELYKEAINRFQIIFSKALQADIEEPSAFTLATVGADGQPTARTLLLKDANETGFVFYTNTKSRKGHQLAENANVGLCFFWISLGEQVLVEGRAEPVTGEEADAYWATRPKESQVGAWTSQQSEPLDKRETLISRFEELQKKYETGLVPRPPHWSGYRVVPNRIEFWSARPRRLHERTVYQKTGPTWTVKTLYP